MTFIISVMSVGLAALIIRPISFFALLELFPVRESLSFRLAQADVGVVAGVVGDLFIVLMSLCVDSVISMLILRRRNAKSPFLRPFPGSSGSR